jgi:MFS family permease
MATNDPSLRRATLLVATLASFLTPFLGSSVTVALPVIGREFTLNAVVLNWVAAAYLLAAAVCLVPIGRLADIYGRKRVFACGLVVYILSSVMAALAPSGSLLLAARALQGIGGAMIFGTNVAMLSSVFPPQERGRALGLNVAAVYIGGSAGPFLGGLLTQGLGWRSIFWATAAMALLILVVVVWKQRGEWRPARGESFDPIGSLLYGGMVLALMYGLSRLPSWPGIALVLIGGILIAAFFIWEARAPAPVLNISLFRGNTVFIYSNLAALINYSATSAVGVLLSLFLQYMRGMSPRGAGLVLVVQPVVMALFSPLAGRLSDRVQPRIMASAGMALVTSGLAGLFFLRESTPVSYVYACLAVLGLGFAFFSSPNANAIMSAVEPRHYGVASAALGTMRLMGQTFSLSVTAVVFALYIGSVPITPEVYPHFMTSFKVALAFFTLLCGLGVAASLARGDLKRHASAHQ